LTVVAIFAAAVALFTREPAKATMPAPEISFSIALGISVPRAAELTAKLQDRLRVPAGTRSYVLQNDRWAEVKPSPMAERLNAVVRSYNPKDGVAYVYLTYPEYHMPLIQVWRFDGKVWSDSIDPGIFVR
jgi:hypothetical protein